MKIDDLLGKALVTGSTKPHKSKPATKPKPETPATPPVVSDKSPGEKKSSESPADDTPERVDTYEPQPKSVPLSAKSERSFPAIRKDRVERARQLMAAGAYDNPEIVNKIIDRLIEAIREV